MARKKSVNQIFISRMRLKMAEKGLKQNDLSYMSKIGQGTISEYLNPEIGRNPGAAELGRLANTLGVTMGWLWGTEDENPMTEAIPAPIQKIIKLEGKLEFARKTLRGALAYLEEEEYHPELKVAEDSENYYSRQ